MSKAHDLMNVIREAQAELSQLQQQCSHTHFTVHMYSWRVGSFNPARVCDDCGDTVTGLTEDEAKSCWDQWKADWNV